MEIGPGARSSSFARMSRMLHRALYLHIVFAHEDAIFLVFSHPDYTVGPGTSPGPASPYKEWLAGSTADQELRRQFTCLPSPCPEDISVFNFDAPIIAYREARKQI
jgi:hypothetical protein